MLIQWLKRPPVPSLSSLQGDRAMLKKNTHPAPMKVSATYVTVGIAAQPVSAAHTKPTAAMEAMAAIGGKSALSASSVPRRTCSAVRVRTMTAMYFSAQAKSADRRYPAVAPRAVTTAAVPDGAAAANAAPKGEKVEKILPQPRRKASRPLAVYSQ